MQFARVSTMLRAPRVAVLITHRQWQEQAAYALEALSRMWGGAGGVIVALGPNGELHAQVFEALREFDPDYLAPLTVNARQYEAMFPGALGLTDHRGRTLRAPSTRKRLLDQFGDDMGTVPLFRREHVEALGARLNTFKDDGERVFGISSSDAPSGPLSPSPTQRSPDRIAHRNYR